jgi:hypothetical protein
MDGHEKSLPEQPSPTPTDQPLATSCATLSTPDSSSFCLQNSHPPCVSFGEMIFNLSCTLDIANA